MKTKSPSESASRPPSRALALAEFDRQVANLIALGYPQHCGLSPTQFATRCEELRPIAMKQARRPGDGRTGRFPFLLTVPRERVGVAAGIRGVRREGKRAIVRLAPARPADFVPLASLRVPEGPVYLLLDVSRGDDLRNVRPEDALKTIHRRRRSPLTMEEGIAVLVHHPDALIKNHCFSLPGSRRGDQRVPALWLSGGRVKLGWCWDRNPHTWLGCASCRRRYARPG